VRTGVEKSYGKSSSGGSSTHDYMSDSIFYLLLAKRSEDVQTRRRAIIRLPSIMSGYMTTVS
jgi:hypothetical protein